MDNLILPNHQFSIVGWTPDKDLSYEEWNEIGQGLARVGAAVNWWIGDWINYGEPKYGKKYTQALEIFAEQYEYNMLARMASVSKRVDFSIRILKLSWNHHFEIAKLDEEAQVELLDLAVRNHLSVRELREEVRKHKRDLYLQEKGVDIQTVDINMLPSGMYRIIYADPPWSYSNSMPEIATDASNYYPSMTIEAIEALPVSRLAMDGAVLFLWSTSPHLPEAIQVAESWGFEYKTSFVWDKVKHNMGHYNSVRHELLLVCTRGSCPPDVQKLHDSVIVEERSEHSVKPEIFRNIIDELYVDGRRVELFARKPVEGWDTWGNETK